MVPASGNDRRNGQVCPLRELRLQESGYQRRIDRRFAIRHLGHPANQSGPPWATQESMSRPCFSTIRSNFAAIAPGCFAPVSHFWTVDGLVFK